MKDTNYFPICLLLASVTLCQGKGGGRSWGSKSPQPGISTQLPYISSMQVRSDIQLRFAHTEVKTIIKNPESVAQEAKFSIRLPDTAFISNFSMRVGEGEEVVAQVMRKKQAQETFTNASQQGMLAGLVSQMDSDSNQFSVSTSLPAGQKVVFSLNYEELLKRKNGFYEHILDIRPGAVVENLKMEVLIAESLPIASLAVLENVDTNQIDSQPGFQRRQKNKLANVTEDFKNGKAEVLYEPSSAQQQAKGGKTGLSDQMIIKYDLDWAGQENEVQVLDGYFVHFFSPKGLEPLPKHVVFVLDISGSMHGKKLAQMKDAMFTILDDMSSQDLFSIIVFSSGVQKWTSNELEGMDKDSAGPLVVIQATKHNRDIAIFYINQLKAGGGTNINEALLEGIEMAEQAKIMEILPDNTESIIVFLTDGEATNGVTNEADIRNNVKNRNAELTLPIYCLAFGRGSDFTLMKKISLEAKSFAKRIYEGSDAALQLEDFFGQISSPLISDLNFTYVGEVENASISEVNAGTFFKGGEYVVVGKLSKNITEDEKVLTVIAQGKEKKGPLYNTFDICLRPTPLPALISPYEGGINKSVKYQRPICTHPRPLPEMSKAQMFMRKLYAFVTIQQLLKSDTKEDIEDATQLSLDNNLVTELTSLVVTNNQQVTLVSTDPIPSYLPQSRVQGVGRSVGSLRTRKTSSRHSSKSRSSRYGSLSRSKTSYGGRGSSMNKASLSVQPRKPSVILYAAPVPASSYAMYDLAPATSTLDMAYDLAPAQNPTTKSCTVKLYAETYHRGANVTLTKDTPNLATEGFTNRLVSLEVLGSSCCWEVFTMPSYRGVGKKFYSHQMYTSTSDMGQLFRKAKSAKIC